jgi:hypothetical protein
LNLALFWKDNQSEIPLPRLRDRSDTGEPRGLRA